MMSWICRNLAACHYADYKPIYIIVNSGIFLILIIAKIPEMHRVRIFGINANKFEASEIPTPISHSSSKQSVNGSPVPSRSSSRLSNKKAK